LKIIPASKVVNIPLHNNSEVIISVVRFISMRETSFPNVSKPCLFLRKTSEKISSKILLVQRLN
jgi:hypothetical protein